MTSDKKHKPKLKKILSYILPFILTGVFLYLAFKDVNLSEAFKLIEKASIPYLLLFVAVFYLSHILRAIRWKVIISSVKKDASVVNLLGATMIGYGVNCVIPRLGELYRGLFLGKWENLSRSSMLGTIVVERIIDILALGFAVLISVMIYPGNLYKDLTWLKSAIILGFIAIFLMIVLLILVVKLKEKFYNAILKLVGKISQKLADKLAEIFHTLTEGFATLRTWKSYLLTFLLTVAIMVVYGYTSYVGFFIVGMEGVKDITYAMAWILMTISAFGIIIPTPGGTGSYHALTIFVLANIFGFTEEMSAAYAILTHLVSYFVFIASTILFTYGINKMRQKKGIEKEDFLSVFKNTRNAK